MTGKQQPEALRLAEQYDYGDPAAHSNTWKAAVCTELRRLHAENTTLQAGYTAARLEIESLQRRVQEVGAVARREHERADRAMRAAQPAEAPQPSPAALRDALDAARMNWLENDVGCRVFHLGKSWYTRDNFGMPYRKRASLREAIDAARAAQEGK